MISDQYYIDEYDYTGFEYDSRALYRVCGHAAAMAKRLERNPEDEVSRLAIRQDYYNAILCLKIGKHGRREIVDHFTRYMLYEEWETVFDAITEAYEDNKARKRDELIDNLFIPDYSQLFLDMADYALFKENNYEKAIKGYTVATYEWKMKYEKQGDYSLSIPTKRIIRSYIELFSAIREGRYLGKDTSFLSVEEKAIIIDYKTILEKHYEHKSIIDEVERLIGQIDEILKKQHPPKESTWHIVTRSMFDDPGFNKIRIICFLVPRLYELAYLDEIKELSNESKSIQNTLSEKAIKKVKFLSNTELEWISNVIIRFDEKKMWDVLTLISRAVDDVERIKEVLLIKYDIPQLAYYTTWETLSYMLPQNEGDEGNTNVGKLSVMHLSYMNDPMEGNVINEFLYGKDIQAGRKQDKQPYVFVKCFTQSIDYLPMWKMYGGNAEGCCVIIDWNKTKQSNEGKPIELYRVCYLTKKDDASYTFLKKDNNNEKTLDGIGKLLEQLKVDMVKLRNIEEGHRITDSILKNIAYLFKDSSYSYEQEVRILYSYNRLNNQIKKTKQTPPKLFVYTDYNILIDELILGPKFKDIYLWTPFIKSQLEKMCKKTGQKDDVKLTLSEINYR